MQILLKSSIDWNGRRAAGARHPGSDARLDRDGIRGVGGARLPTDIRELSAVGCATRDGREKSNLGSRCSGLSDQWRSASMPRAMPSSVSGYIRGPMAFCTIWVDRVYSHARGGSGFHQITRRKWSPRRFNHSTPGSSFAYSTLPPSCRSSYGLIAASPTKMSFQSGPYLWRMSQVGTRSARRRWLSRHTWSYTQLWK